jgi:hypothetical protein
LGNVEKRRVAERRGTPRFDVLITADKNIRYQQNLQGRKIAIVILTQLRWRLVRRALVEIASAVNACGPGGCTEVEIPYD